ncbi:nucleotidyltransferase domain-containing protein [Tenacibaculum maritimum]|uniref:nucleotidyltransferase domain-containing protein n=1 Tax=Tenacibaculum maritimum TaxID=107401 RepID=UPI0038773A15
MAKDYESLIRKVKNRTNPDITNESVLLEKSFRDELGRTTVKANEYVKRVMRGVEPRYTERTFEAGKKVREHLKKNNPNLDFEFQGSVMTNTHIKGHSDIDLVQITNRFYFHEGRQNFQKAKESFEYSYTEKERLSVIAEGTSFEGDDKMTLREIRIDAENVLNREYKYVDTTKGKSIEVKPTNPFRKVDVVTASWYKNVKAVAKADKEERGIKIYDKNDHKILPEDFPFRKIKLVNQKDSGVNGRLKKMIRFLKNVKVDSDYKIDLTSFDITSISYNIPTYKYYDKSYLELVHVIYEEMYKIYSDKVYRDSIKSVDDTEYIFRNNPEKVEHLRTLLTEVNLIKNDIIVASFIY